MIDTTKLNGWRNGWAPVDRRPIYEWAKDHVVLPSSYAQPGPFDVSTSRYMIEPFDAILSHGVRQVDIRKAIQTAGTLVAEVSILYFLANAPGPIMWTQQSDADAKEHFKGRFNALMKRCAPVAALIPKHDRHAMSTTEVWFGDFFLIGNGANINNLQSKSIRYKINSEVWLWKQGLMSDAKGRVSAFERVGTSKILNESQGSFEGDDADREWSEGTQEHWSVKCEGCGEHAPLEFFGRAKDAPEKRVGVVWSEEARSETGRWNVAKAAETVRYRCPHCGHEHENSTTQRARWNQTGHYQAKNPSAPSTHRSFTWNSLCNTDHAQLVAEYLNATNTKLRGDIVPLQNFFQKRLAKAWRDESQTVDVVELLTSNYTLTDLDQSKSWATKIDNEAHRVMCLDRQKDHLWGVARAIRADGSSRLIFRGRISTPEEAEAIRERFGIPPRLVFQDAQYSTSKVYDDGARFGWTALHGAGQNRFAHYPRGSKKAVYKFYSPAKTANHNGKMVNYLHWSSDPVKDILDRLRKGEGVGWEIPDDVGEDYKAQLNGETKRERINKTTGRPEWRWTKTGPNHLWDCEAMIVLFLLIMGLLQEGPSQDKNEATTEDL